MVSSRAAAFHPIFSEWPIAARIIANLLDVLKFLISAEKARRANRRARDIRDIKEGS
jgi:hypothetical protein